MASKATSTAGMKLSRGDGATPTEAFAPIPEVYSIKRSGSKDRIDVTSFDSGNVREYIGGLQDGDTFDIEYNIIAEDPEQQGLESDRDDGTLRSYEIDYNDATATLTVPSKLTFKALVLSGGASFALNDRKTASATLQVSGAVTRVPRHAGP